MGEVMISSSTQYKAGRHFKVRSAKCPKSRTISHHLSRSDDVALSPLNVPAPMSRRPHVAHTWCTRGGVSADVSVEGLPVRFWIV